jgi:hypothetical protein
MQNYLRPGLCSCGHMVSGHSNGRGRRLCKVFIRS